MPFLYLLAAIGVFALLVAAVMFAMWVTKEIGVIDTTDGNVIDPYEDALEASGRLQAAAWEAVQDLHRLGRAE